MAWGNMGVSRKRSRMEHPLLATRWEVRVGDMQSFRVIGTHLEEMGDGKGRSDGGCEVEMRDSPVRQEEGL